MRRGASVRGAIAIVELAAAAGGRSGARGGALRRAAEAALATRVELRDADAVFDACSTSCGARRRARGGPGRGVRGRRVRRRGRAAQARRQVRRPRRTGRRSRGRRARAAEPAACTLEDRRALAEQLRAAPEDLDGWKLAGDLSAGALAHAGERA